MVFVAAKRQFAERTSRQKPEKLRIDE